MRILSSNKPKKLGPKEETESSKTWMGYLLKTTINCKMDQWKMSWQSFPSLKKGLSGSEWTNNYKGRITDFLELTGGKWKQRVNSGNDWIQKKVTKTKFLKLQKGQFCPNSSAKMYESIPWDSNWISYCFLIFTV